MKGLWNGSEDASLFHLCFSAGKIFISEHFKHGLNMTGTRRCAYWFLLSTAICFSFSSLQEIEYITVLLRPKGSLGWWGFMCEMRPAKLSAKSFKSNWPSARIWFLGARWIDCADPTLAGLAVWAAALERKPKPGKPHPLGEPLHHSPLPEPSPAREGCDLWGGVQTPPQWAHAACGPAHTWACAGQSTVCLLWVSVGMDWATQGVSRV